MFRSKISKLTHYYFLVTIFYYTHCANVEIYKFASPSMCVNNEYFNAESLVCVECKAAENLKPSPDRLECICREDSKFVGFENGHPKCEKCGLDKQPSADGMDCIFCSDISSNSSCNCSPSEIKLERDINGKLMDNLECLPCSENSYPSPDGSKCLPCHSSAIKSHPNCPCPVTSHLRIQQYCIRKSGLTDWPDLRSTYLVKYRSQNVDSYYFRTELHLAVHLCKNGDRMACEHLSNMCALTLFTDSMPCKLFLDKPGSPLWVFYEEGEAPMVLNRKKISQKYTLDKRSNSSMLNFNTATFTLNGKLESIGVPKIFCAFLSNVRFGLNFDKHCRITGNELTKTKMEFFVPYLEYNEGKEVFLYAVPILVKNTNKDRNEASQWQLVRKFFLVDTVSGVRALPNSLSTTFKKDSTFTVVRYMKSLHVLVKVQNKEERGKIFPPLLVIEYGELSKDDIRRNVEITIDYKVTYVLTDDDLYNAVEVSAGVLSGFAVAFSAVKAWSYCRRNGKSIPNTSLFVWFLLYSCGALGNVFVLVTLCASVYTFVFYKGQTVLHVLLPSDENEENIRILVIAAFLLKVVEVVAFMYQQRSVSLFFIDWEQPRSIQKYPHYDSPHTSLKKLYTNRFSSEKHSPLRTSSEMIMASKKRTASKSMETKDENRYSRNPTPNKSNDENFMETASDMSLSMGDLGDSNGQRKFPVSIWRTYLIANEWFKIQTKRKVNMPVQGIATLLILEVIGVKFWAYPVPELTIQGQKEIAETQQSFILRFAVGVLVYLTVYYVQWLISVIFFKRYVKDCIQEFVDLCSMANISVFILALNNYGFYIHGRSVHGFADTDLGTLVGDLKREEENLCAHRGLVPGTEEQTFVISVSTTFRAFYNKIINPLNSIGNRFERRHGSEGSIVEKDIQAHHKMNKFLIGFLDHCFKDLDYIIKEKPFLEKLCDIELTDVVERSVFYIDKNRSFDRVMFHGNEWTLASFEVTLFAFIEALSANYVLSISLTVLVSQILVIINRFNGKNDLASKTLIDKRFLV